jgi:3'-phosphoadenosine 5'-phosphosulfate sulfotransferase (PAPS reductase)/FAD synthetase
MTTAPTVQLGLDLFEPELGDILELVADSDRILLATSAGKDSAAMTAYVYGVAARVGATDRIVMVHNDLGATPGGLSLEWPGVKELAQEHADMFGLPLVETQRANGGLWRQMENERHFWPGPGRLRYCTGDQKTKPTMKLVTREVGQLDVSDRPARVLYCLGLRAEESRDRACKKPVEVLGSHSSGRRTITRWLPILSWTTAQVWDQIHVAGMPHHWAYDAGMSRLSCAICVLASRADLILAARLRPRLAAEYLARERRLHQHENPKVRQLANFRADISMAEIVATARMLGPTPWTVDE